MIKSVYIAGACPKYGRVTARAGYGIYFGENHSKNEYGSVDKSLKQRKSVGYLLAFIRCLEIIKDPVNIYSDVDFEMVMIGTKSQELREKANMSYAAAKDRVTLIKISTHTGYDSEQSRGNAGAHTLAHMGASSIKILDSIKLDIPFVNKDKAKELGAHWDPRHKTWYLNTKYVSWHEVRQRLKELEKINKIYIKISYANKNKAKKLGAQWDPRAKSWYYIEGSNCFSYYS